MTDVDASAGAIGVMVCDDGDSMVTLGVVAFMVKMVICHGDLMVTIVLLLLVVAVEKGGI